MGLVLLADALVLMARGMFNLGVTLPAALGLLLVVCSWNHGRIAQRLQDDARLRRLWRLGCWSLLLWLASLLAFWAQLLLHMRQPVADVPLQAIVVLGSATRDGQPSLALAQRLDRAAELARTQPQALVVTSGGVDFGEQESEGAIMARYLRQRHGLAAGRLLVESRSTSTALNLAWSLPLLRERGIGADAPMAVVTSDFHTLRAGWIARRSGYGQAMTVGAPTPLSIRANAWLREYFAVLSGWVLGEF
jgi:uncharacterized SAM-binding protein YcdF (DUF218 family)